MSTLDEESAHFCRFVFLAFIDLFCIPFWLSIRENKYAAGCCMRLSSSNIYGNPTHLWGPWTCIVNHFLSFRGLWEQVPEYTNPKPATRAQQVLLRHRRKSTLIYTAPRGPLFLPRTICAALHPSIPGCPAECAPAVSDGPPGRIGRRTPLVPPNKARPRQSIVA